MYLNERSLKTLDKLATWADKYSMAHNKKLPSKHSIRRGENLNVYENDRSPERPREILNCYRCEVKDIVQWIARQRYWMNVVEVETKGFRATDVVDLDTKREAAGPSYPVSLPHDLDPVESSLQCKFIEWDAPFSFPKHHHRSQQGTVKFLN